MRILHFSDLHIGVENYGRVDPETGLSTRLQDFLDPYDEAVDFALENGVDLVLFYKHLMVLNGDEEYRLHFNETDALSDAQRAHVEAQYDQFKRWYADWAA